ncbi:MAG: polysaccharide deacetylase family protein [Ignavibacteriales bacterium]|nr:polysaccharide deacetylase family protein [Ignavibacteriales bacterium]
MHRNWIHGVIALATAASFFMLSLHGTKQRVEVTLPFQPEGPPVDRVASTDSLTIPLLATAKPSGTIQPIAPVVILHGPRDLKVIALTFDACSTTLPSRYDERITNILIETKTPATLFLGGKWMEEEPEHTRQLASHPQFELANHTYQHPHLNTMSDDSIRHELQRTQDVMDSLTGKRPTLFRPPYGEYNDRVVRVAAELGLKTIQFDLASGDPDPGFTKEKLISYVTSMAKNGSIVVMHINRRGWHTAEALPEIIARLRGRGFTFETVSEMISQTNQR